MFHHDLVLCLVLSALQLLAFHNQHGRGDLARWVPMLPPNPSMGSLAARADQLGGFGPRTQRGTITGSPRTFSANRRARISWSIRVDGRLASGVPLKRAPNRPYTSSAVRL